MDKATSKGYHQWRHNLTEGRRRVWSVWFSGEAQSREQTSSSLLSFYIVLVENAFIGARLVARPLSCSYWRGHFIRPPNVPEAKKLCGQAYCLPAVSVGTPKGRSVVKWESGIINLAAMIPRSHLFPVCISPWCLVGRDTKAEACFRNLSGGQIVRRRLCSCAFAQALSNRLVFANWLWNGNVRTSRMILAAVGATLLLFVCRRDHSTTEPFNSLSGKILSWQICRTNHRFNAFFCGMYSASWYT